MKETFVRVYDVDKAYGGPEEGGWWYTDYNERESVPVSTMKEAREIFKTLLEKYRPEKDNWDVKGKTAMGYGRYRMDSVRSEGEIWICIENGPSMHTTERPRYC